MTVPYQSYMHNNKVTSNSAGNGQYLACGCADKATYTIKMPPASKRVHAFVGMLTNMAITLCPVAFSIFEYEVIKQQACYTHCVIIFG